MKTEEELHKETCPYCGAKVNERFEILTKGLCETLIKFYDAIRATNRPRLHLQEDCRFTKSEFTNFQKLRYFGLVEKTNVAGYWKLTDDGIEFLVNDKKINKRVVVFRNRVVRRSREKIILNELLESSEKYWLKKYDYLK